MKVLLFLIIFKSGYGGQTKFRIMVLKESSPAWAWRCRGFPWEFVFFNSRVWSGLSLLEPQKVHKRLNCFLSVAQLWISIFPDIPVSSGFPSQVEIQALSRAGSCGLSSLPGGNGQCAPADMCWSQLGRHSVISHTLLCLHFPFLRHYKLLFLSFEVSYYYQNNILIYYPCRWNRV